jgi:hypothetical protein
VPSGKAEHPSVVNGAMAYALFEMQHIDINMINRDIVFNIVSYQTALQG